MRILIFNSTFTAAMCLSLHKLIATYDKEHTQYNFHKNVALLRLSPGAYIWVLDVYV